MYCLNDELLYAKMDLEIRDMFESIRVIHEKASEDGWTLKAEIEDTIIEIDTTMLKIKYLKEKLQRLG